MRAQLEADASDALNYYGGTLDIRRAPLKLRVRVHRVRLIYESGALKYGNSSTLKDAVSTVEKNVEGVEVLFQ